MFAFAGGLGSFGDILEGPGPWNLPYRSMARFHTMMPIATPHRKVIAFVVSKTMLFIVDVKLARIAYLK